MEVKEEVWQGACGDAFFAAGNAFTGKFWRGPQGMAFCGARNQSMAFMVDGECTEEIISCQVRKPSKDGDPFRGPRIESLPENGTPLAAEPAINKLLTRSKQDTLLRGASKKGTVRNLVLMLQFSNVPSSEIPKVEDFEKLFNGEDSPDGRVIFTESIRSFYYKMSGGQLTIDSVLSGWIPIPYTKEAVAGPCKRLPESKAGDVDGLECCNGISCPRGVSNNLVQAAIMKGLEIYEQRMGASFFSQFDEDRDGMVDMFTVIQSGHGAEATAGDGVLSTSIWSHKYYLAAFDWNSARQKCGDMETNPNYLYCSAYSLPRSGMRFNSYNINPALWFGGSKTIMDRTVQISRIGVIAHELGHFLGLPDYYDTDSSSSGLSTFDLMSNSWGVDGSQNYPPQLSAASKEQLGWLSSVDLVRDIAKGKPFRGRVTLPDVHTSGSAFKIQLSPTEYYIIENRQPTGTDQQLIGGILIFHVDLSVPTNANEFAYSKPLTWKTEHPQVRLVQPDGFYDLEEWVKKPRDSKKPSYQADAGDWFPYTDPRTGKQVELSDSNTGPVLNINSYASLGKPSSIRLSDFDKSGPIMGFNFEYKSNLLPPAPTPGPTRPPKSQPTNPVTVGLASFITLCVLGILYAEHDKWVWIRKPEQQPVENKQKPESKGIGKRESVQTDVSVSVHSDSDDDDDAPATSSSTSARKSRVAQSLGSLPQGANELIRRVSELASSAISGKDDAADVPYERLAVLPTTENDKDKGMSYKQPKPKSASVSTRKSIKAPATTTRSNKDADKQATTDSRKESAITGKDDAADVPDERLAALPTTENDKDKRRSDKQPKARSASVSTHKSVKATTATTTIRSNKDADKQATSDSGKESDKRNTLRKEERKPKTKSKPADDLKTMPDL